MTTVEGMERQMKLYKEDTPIYIQHWGEKTLHAIRFITQRYDKDTNEPYIVITPEDDISKEED